MKTFSITDILTDEEIDKAWHLFNTLPETRFVDAVEAQLITPNMERINKVLGQENDPRFLAYSVLYVFSQIHAVRLKTEPAIYEPADGQDYRDQEIIT